MRLKAVIAGAIAFGLAHLTLVLKWQTWFDGGPFDAWFLNGGTSTAFAAALLAGVAAVLAAFDSTFASALADAWNVAAGAIVAMVIVLFTLPRGPGTIAPIVIGAGVLVIVASSVAGAAIGTALGRLARTRGDTRR